METTVDALSDRMFGARLVRRMLGNRLVRGTFWSLSGSVGARTFGLLSSFIVARILGTAGFGELGLIQSTIGMLGTLGGFGLGLTSTKYVAEFRTSDPTAAGRMISVAYVGALSATVLLSSIIIASSTDFATRLLGNAHLSPHLQAGTLLLVINGINGVQLGALAGFEAFRALAVVNLWAAGLSFPLVILGANLAGSYGAVWGMIATAGVNCALCHRALAHVMSKYGVRGGFSGCRTEISKLWSFSLPSFLTMSLAGPVMWLGNAMLVHESNGYSEMGIFNAANQWGAVILFIPFTLAQPTLAILSNHGGSGDKESFKNCLLHSIILTSVSCLTVGLIVAITGTVIMRAYGMGFSAGVPVLLTSVGAAVLAAPQIPILHAMTATGRVWQNVAIHLAWAATFLIVASITHGSGAKGLALNYVFAYLVQGVVYAFVLPSAIRLRE